MTERQQGETTRFFSRMEFEEILRDPTAFDQMLNDKIDAVLQRANRRREEVARFQQFEKGIVAIVKKLNRYLMMGGITAEQGAVIADHFQEVYMQYIQAVRVGEKGQAEALLNIIDGELSKIMRLGEVQTVRGPEAIERITTPHIPRKARQS